MKKSARILKINGNFLKFLLLTAFLTTSSCISTQTRMLGKDEMANANILGRLDVKFVSVHPFNIYNKEKIIEKAYNMLKDEATKRYPQHKTDVVNINIQGLLVGGVYPAIFLFTWPLGNIQSIYVRGDVIATDATSVTHAQQVKPSAALPVEPRAETHAQTAGNAASGLEQAVKKAASKLMNDLPRGSKIAVVDVATDNWEIASTVIDEVEFNFVSSKRYAMVDRKTLDVIRSEQKLQTSGEVSDATVVKIGALSGANVVITGSLTKSGGTNRLSLRALDVQTGQIITMARESY